MEYVFYFDESFHDKKITVNPEGKLNILAKDKLDSYVGLFWGCKKEDLAKNEKMMSEFEIKQRERFRLDEDKELKSTTISKSSFEYGVASFSRDAFGFYKDLFSMLEKIEPTLQVNVISKMEFFISHIFYKAISQNKSINRDVFIYTLTKFLIHYGTNDLFKTLVNVHDKETSEILKNKLIYIIDKILENNSQIKRKEKECNAFLKLRNVIADIDLETFVNSKIDFRYFPNFDGLLLLLQELNIDPKNIDLMIDNEENTYQIAKKYPFNKIECIDSKKNAEIRLSDFLSGFIGRLIYAMENDPKMSEDEVTDIDLLKNNDLETKRILSSSWFDITKERFDLYRLICKVMVNKQNHYWSYMTVCYFDQVIAFVSLLKYFEEYPNYEMYSKIDFNMHAERYNAFNCMFLMGFYKMNNYNY